MPINPGMHPVLCNAADFVGRAPADWIWPRSRILILGVMARDKRARLLQAGYGDVMGMLPGLAEIEQRALRIQQIGRSTPRLRSAGPLLLDLFHRDARLGSRWLRLFPREFALLWKLAEKRGKLVSRWELLRDVWRLAHEPETNSVEVHISRLRSKLATVGLGHLVATGHEGGYFLAIAPGQDPILGLDPADALSKDTREKEEISE